MESQDEARRANVLMEQMLSKFDVFGESLSDVRERVGRIETDLHTVKEDVVVLKIAARTHTDAIKANTEAIHAVQADLKNINQRVEILEAK